MSRHGAALLAVAAALVPPLVAAQAATATATLEDVARGFADPPVDCWPHTRWWWPGSAVTPEGITWQLEGMRSHGIGGVEQISMGAVYEKGNIDYLSEPFLEMLKHTVLEAKRLGMEVSINFGGPGWVIGGAWVPPEDRAKDLVPTFVDLAGPQSFRGPLPDRLTQTARSWELHRPALDGTERLLAVVAARLDGARLAEETLTLLAPPAAGEAFEWAVPPGSWRLMAFWLKPTGQGDTVDHFSKPAMERYCAHLGGILESAIGAEFGKTVDSLFCDSFEVANTSSGIYWSDGLLDEFRARKGYDLSPYLPAIWWEVGEIAPKIRYDVNEFLHQIGREAFFETFLGWCARHGVRGRIQPYGFTTDNIEAAGLTHIPEMEITAGEKDAVPWFDTRIGPRKYVASGAHLYGRNVVSTEAYTFMHWELYRSTLEELKIASDMYLASGANKFYNHGYSYSPERDIAPSRTIGFAALITHQNVWWEYYPLLARYIARCCYLLRQGEFTADIALYSPLANQWTRDVLNARKWTRGFDWGALGALLMGNGYDFDLVNDHALQELAEIDEGQIRIGPREYRILILPDVQALPLATLEFVECYVAAGGAAIALERTPDQAVGFVDHARQDAAVRSIVEKLFATPRGADDVGALQYGRGWTYHIENVIDRQDVLDRRSSAWDPFAKTLRRHCTPDFGIDFAREGLRENLGLTFIHRRRDDAEIYFVANVQDRAVAMPVALRTCGRQPWRWDPHTGAISQIAEFRARPDAGCTEIPVRLAPFESTFILFAGAPEPEHVTRSDFLEIRPAGPDRFEGVTDSGGVHAVEFIADGEPRSVSVAVDGVPPPLAIGGAWRLALEGRGFEPFAAALTHLTSWTADPRTEHFSGTGRYELEFDLPAQYVAADIELMLELGRVGNVAEVELNGSPVGVAWMREQPLDVTEAVTAGTNRLVILVTNTLINRASGLNSMPPVPPELVAHHGSGETAYSRSFRGPVGFEPLPASGLLGPVRIRAYRRVPVFRAFRCCRPVPRRLTDCVATMENRRGVETTKVTKHTNVEEHALTP